MSVKRRPRTDGKKPESMTPDDILQAIESHERWLKRKPGGLRADLSGLEVTGFQLARVNLQSARLSGVNFANTLLSGADLSYADLFCANLDDSDLTNAVLMRADLRGASIRGANLGGANLKEADMRGGAIINDLTGEKPTFIRADASSSTLDDADINNANLSGTNLSNSSMIGANLENTLLCGANLSGVNLENANLTGADLSGANLANAKIIGANLRGANLRGALISETSFAGSDLSSAILERVNLSTANLSGAQLVTESGDRSRSLRDIVNDHELWIREQGRGGTRAQLAGANLKDVDLSDINLSGADLRDVDLSGAKMRRAQLVMTDLTGAEDIHLVAAARPVLLRPDRGCSRPQRHALHIPVPVGIDLRQRARLADERIVRWHGAVIINPGNAANMRAEVLRLVHMAAPVAHADEQRAIRREDKTGAEMPPAADLRLLAEDHVEVRQGAIGQARSRDFGSGATVAPPGEGQIDQPVFGKIRMQHHVEQATLTGSIDLRRAAHRLRLQPVRPDDPQRPFPLGHENAAVRQKGQPPGMVQPARQPRHPEIVNAGPLRHGDVGTGGTSRAAPYRQVRQPPRPACVKKIPSACLPPLQRLSWTWRHGRHLQDPGGKERCLPGHSANPHKNSVLFSRKLSRTLL